MEQSRMINVQKNLIAGPGPRDFWNHSGGLEKPEVNEEGPWAVQGNLNREVILNDFSKCSYGDMSIGGSPNCVNVFVPDMFTTKDTCGLNCSLKNPEIFGMKDFGFKEGSSKVTNAHQLHSFINIRAATAGQNVGKNGEFGCYEDIPRLSVDPKTNTCYLDPQKEYEQTKNWGLISQFSNLFFPK